MAGSMGADDYSGMSTIERGVHLYSRLARGEALRARDIARQYGVSVQWSYGLLDQLARVAPIYSDAGLWRVLDVTGPADGQ